MLCSRAYGLGPSLPLAALVRSGRIRFPRWSKRWSDRSKAPMTTTVQQQQTIKRKGDLFCTSGTAHAAILFRGVAACPILLTHLGFGFGFGVCVCVCVFVLFGFALRGWCYQILWRLIQDAPRFFASSPTQSCGMLLLVSGVAWHRGGDLAALPSPPSVVVLFCHVDCAVAAVVAGLRRSAKQTWSV